jgi:hypothetical protein
MAGHQSGRHAKILNDGKGAETGAFSLAGRCHSRRRTHDRQIRPSRERAGRQASVDCPGVEISFEKATDIAHPHEEDPRVRRAQAGVRLRNGHADLEIRSIAAFVRSLDVNPSKSRPI